MMVVFVGFCAYLCVDSLAMPTSEILLSPHNPLCCCVWLFSVVLLLVCVLLLLLQMGLWLPRTMYRSLASLLLAPHFDWALLSVGQPGASVRSKVHLRFVRLLLAQGYPVCPLFRWGAQPGFCRWPFTLLCNQGRHDSRQRERTLGKAVETGASAEEEADAVSAVLREGSIFKENTSVQEREARLRHLQRGVESRIPQGRSLCCRKTK